MNGRHHPSDRGSRLHLPGLDSLRFYAAMFVVIGHIPLNQMSLGLPAYSTGTFFYRGSTAVSFFFSLSGFLISYLLLQEQTERGTVSVRAFYLRRICRIWPVYFAVVIFGLFFYNALLPALSIPYRVEYDLPLAAVLYAFFLPNLMNSLYSVGGILNPSWSIGVEEQFYLAWAPAFRRFHRRFGRLCGLVLLISGTVAVANALGAFGTGWLGAFVSQLRFHYMAAGGLCAWWLHTRRERFLALPIFSSRIVQVTMLALLVEFYLVGRIHWTFLGSEALQLVLYPWLIVTVSANPANIVPAGNRLFDQGGKISYGIYMFHMIVVYATSALFLHSTWWKGHLPLYYAAYYGLAIGGTLLIARLSYQYFERPFLRLKDRRFRSVGSTSEAAESGAPVAVPVAVGTAIAKGRSGRLLRRKRGPRAGGRRQE